MAKILLEQYNIPRLEINSIQFHGQDDLWTYIWGNAQFSSSKAYKSLKEQRYPCCLFTALAKLMSDEAQNILLVPSKGRQIKHKTTVKEEKYGTAVQSYNCVLSNLNVEESLLDLFLHYPFSKQCWERINLQTYDKLTSYENLEALRRQIRQTFFLEVIILMSSSIRTVRNMQIFYSQVASLNGCKAVFRKEFALLLHRAKVLSRCTSKK